MHSKHNGFTSPLQLHNGFAVLQNTASECDQGLYDSHTDQVVNIEKFHGSCKGIQVIPQIDRDLSNRPSDKNDSAMNSSGSNDTNLDFGTIRITDMVLICRER